MARCFASRIYDAHSRRHPLRATPFLASDFRRNLSAESGQPRPASADASFRRYFRLDCDSEHGKTLIAVDAPPPEKCREFVQVAGLLEAANVHVPKILQTDFDAGFMLVTDLGTTTYMSVLDEKNARPLMRAAIDSLIRFQRTAREGVLPPFDEAFLRREMELMPEWFIGRHLGREVTADERKTLDDTFTLLAESALAQPQTFMLRDFMPRNLMVSEPNPGVLDFQDAVYGPITYDMASLMRDAFISWDEEFQLDCIAYYWERAKKAGLDVDLDFGEFYRQLEWMGLQRHIKVLGLFARIHYRDGKSHYLADLPRFIGYARKVAGVMRRSGRSRACSIRSKAARSKSAIHSDSPFTHDPTPEDGDDLRRRPRRAHAPAHRYMPEAAARSGRQAAHRLADRAARGGGRRNHRHQSRMARRADRSGARRRIALGRRVALFARGEALETAGGIAKALPLIGEGVFIAVSGDVFCDFDYATLRERAGELTRSEQPGLHLVMTPNPPFHPNGDFALINGKLALDGSPRYTFGNIGLYDTRMFRDLAPGTRRALTPYYRETIAQGRATGELYEGRWENVGTPQQLQSLDKELRAR